jgi:hypothetical protein
VASKNPTNLTDYLKIHHSTRYNENVAKESEQTEAKVKRVQEGAEYIQPIKWSSVHTVPELQLVIRYKHITSHLRPE